MDLSGIVARVGAIARHFGIDSLMPQLGTCEELLGGGVVDVAVLGQFKAGKSSFLNALIGASIVPVDVLPSTAVVTRIGHGKRERVTVRGLAGEPFEIPLRRLAEFVTERGNPANEQRVAVVDVELPSLAPYEGIRFVDTPGLGSVFAHNTRVSKEWMPRVGAALVAVSVNHPLSEDDLLLLNDVSLHTPEAVLLLTKADLVSGEELASVIEFTRSQAISRKGKEWRILPVSNRPGFEGMRREVAEYLRERIAGRREEALGEIARHKIHALVAGCREYLNLAGRAAEAADSARSDLAAAMARERRDFGSVKGELRLLCNHLQAEVRTAADERFHAYRGEVTRRVTANLREAMAEWKGHLGRVTREFEGWLADAMMEEMGAVSLHGEGHLAGFLFRAQASVERSVRAFVDRLAGEIARHKVRALISGCREYLILASLAAGAADTARSDLVAALARERRAFGSVKGELRLLCNHLQAEVRTAADERFHAYHGEVTGRVTGNLREAMTGWKGHLGRVTREFEGWLADAMLEEMGAVSLHGEGHLAGFLFRAQASVERSVRAFADRLAREIERALGVRFEGARFDPQVEEPAHPDVRLSPTFDTHFELLWFLIPMPVFRPLVRRHFLRRIPWEVEKNLSRVAGQWADAMGASIDILYRDATAFLEREVGTIAALIGEAEAGDRGGEIRAALGELADLESAVS